jgi:hypothetical protein
VIERSTVDGAVSSLQTFVVTAFATLFVWSVCWPSTIEALMNRHAARDLSAWLGLKQLAAEMPKRFNVPPQPKDVLDSLFDEWNPVHTMFPVGAPNKVSLKVISSTDAIGNMDRFGGTFRVLKFGVRSESGHSPLDDYALVLVTPVSVTPKPEIGEGTEWLTVARRDLDNVPFKPPDFPIFHEIGPLDGQYLESKLNELGRYDWSFSSLTANDPAVTSFFQVVASHENGDFKVFGIALSMGLSFTGVGVVLGAISLWMIGPLIALREANRSHVITSQTWTMTLKTRPGSIRMLLETILIIISVGFAAYPAFVGYLQLSTYIKQQALFTSVERNLMIANCVGLTTSVLVFGAVTLELRRSRRAIDGSGQLGLFLK